LHSFSEAAVDVPPLQRQLTVGPVDDPLEREADRVAAQVMRMPSPAPAISAAPILLRRKCAACEEEAQEGSQLQRKAVVAPIAREVTEAPRLVHQVLDRPGQALDAAARSFFEPRFGYDFSKIRVHADDQATTSAEAMGALAYTVGHHIVVDRGRYAPSTASGRQLLAHELTHAVQQGAAPPARLPSGPVAMRAPPMLARMPRSLSETLNPAALSDDAIAGEINEIRAWLKASAASSEENEALAQTLSRLGAELVARHAAAVPATAPERSVSSIGIASIAAAENVLAVGTPGLGPAPVTRPPFVPFQPPTAPPVELPPAVTPRPPVVPRIAPGAGAGAGPIVVAVLVFLIVLLWPRTSIVSGSEERRQLEEARRRTAFNETDAELEAEAAADEQEDVETPVEQSMKPPGDCTEERHRELQDDVNYKCSRLPRGCTDDMDCRQLKRNWYRNERCARARDRINNECFKGGDRGHRDAALAAWRAAANCREIYRRKC
jgi:hypothetical protein